MFTRQERMVITTLVVPVIIKECSIKCTINTLWLMLIMRQVFISLIHMLVLRFLKKKAAMGSLSTMRIVSLSPETTKLLKSQWNLHNTQVREMRTMINSVSTVHLCQIYLLALETAMDLLDVCTHQDHAMVSAASARSMTSLSLQIINTQYTRPDKCLHKMEMEPILDLIKNRHFFQILLPLLLMRAKIQKQRAWYILLSIFIRFQSPNGTPKETFIQFNLWKIHLEIVQMRALIAHLMGLIRAAHLQIHLKVRITTQDHSGISMVKNLLISMELYPQRVLKLK